MSKALRMLFSFEALDLTLRVPFQGFLATFQAAAISHRGTGLKPAEALRLIRNVAQIFSASRSHV
jgi:hypothetical protein